MTDGLAALLPALGAVPRADGHIVLTQKFHEGVLRQLEEWGGPIRVVMKREQGESHNLDNIAVHPASLPYELVLIDDFRSDRQVAPHIRDAAVVLGSIGWEQSRLSRLAKKLGVPFLYCTEYSLKTRLQIVQCEPAFAPLRYRRYAFELNQERRNRAALRLSAGVQCNGTPTFVAYETLTPSPYLYFDTRTLSQSQITEADLERRLSTLDAGGPLRLVYSGRLDSMKGADHLPAIASELRSLGIAAKLSICGGGPLAKGIEREIQRRGLEPWVEMRGVLSFESELMPFIRSSVDLFICPHVQGDPSCTYVETLGCGVPIVGFNNEAFAGIIKRAPVGAGTPLKDARALARVVERYAADRQALKVASRAALAFAQQHTFESMVRGRIEHLRSCAQAF